ncbi:MAG: hypothetical protein MJH10_10355 [Epibacterium sp.]|nr:hypothetical protein [Epibacterium sp.]NQX73941.1 hypothetical protein [Epibacterium sp.]
MNAAQKLMVSVREARLTPPWRFRKYLFGEAEIEEARKLESQGLGVVIDDGHPPAIWQPKRGGEDG